MRILCLVFKVDYVWMEMQKLCFLLCPTCKALALPPRPRVLDAQEVLDLLLSITASGGDYYKKDKMHVLLT